MEEADGQREAASSPPRPPPLPFPLVSGAQRYFCFEAFKQVLGAQIQPGFLATHTTDLGGLESPSKGSRCAPWDKHLTWFSPLGNGTRRLQREA